MSTRPKAPKLVSFIFTLCVCLVLATFAYADSLVVLLEGLGGRISSPGIVSFQEELSVIPNTKVALPLAQHNWRNAVKLIQQQKPETKIIVIGYSLGANNSTYLAKNVKHVDELIAIQASVWGRATAVGENVDKAIEIYNPKLRAPRPKVTAAERCPRSCGTSRNLRSKPSGRCPAHSNRLG